MISNKVLVFIKIQLFHVRNTVTFRIIVGREKYTKYTYITSSTSR